ncbi:MAG TPA: FAD:protein FMN transferase [Kofleriaceae bacterium]|nr:FAD:protein FMN transferase [Kofleriaceae bacterium]
MNTDVTVAAPVLDEQAEHELARAVADLFAETERRFSRFRPDSELSRLNRATEAIDVSPELLELLLRARRHVADTQGIFDPTVGAALVAAGYDRSFERGALDRDTPGIALRSQFADLEIDEQHGRVVRPLHVQVDLGGFLKGLTVDRAARLAPSPAVIDAGGDAVLSGDGPDDAGWLVDIEDPIDDQRVLTTLRIRNGAVATSAPNRRQWRAGTGVAHHLIDPRTGAPSTSDLAQVTVLAPTAERADVLAKTAFVLGRDAGSRALERQPDIAAVLVLDDGSLHTIGDLDHA